MIHCQEGSQDLVIQTFALQVVHTHFAPVSIHLIRVLPTWHLEVTFCYMRSSLASLREQELPSSYWIAAKNGYGYESSTTATKIAGRLINP